MKVSYRNLLLASVLSSAAILAAASASAETLQDALSSAYQNNPTLQAERALLRSTDEGVSQASAGWRPTVSIVGEGGRKRVNSSVASSDYSASYYTTTLQIKQNLYAGGGTEAGIAKAEADVQAGRASLLNTEQGVLLDAVTAYMNVQRDQAVLDLNKQNEIRLQRQLEATRDRFNVGEVTRTDVAQAESRLSRARADRIAAEGDLQVSKAFYEQVVGAAPGKLETPKLQLALPMNRDEAVTLATEKNFDVVTRKFEREAAKNTIDVQYADLLPSVDLVADASRAKNTSSLKARNDEVSLAAQVTVPLYQAGLASSQVRAAKQLEARSAKRIDEATRKAVESSTAAWERLQATRAQIKAYEEEVRAAEIALEGVQQEAAVGSRTVLDVLDAEQELLDARVKLVRAQRDETVAQFDLLSAVGGLTAKDLNLDVAVYDVDAHYKAVKDRWWGVDTDTGDRTEMSQ